MITSAMEKNDPEQYKEYVEMRLDALTPIFAKAAVGNFSSNVEIPSTDDKFTELYMGIQIMLEVIRAQTEELSVFNKELESRIALQHQELQKQNSLLQTILKSIGDGIIVADLKGDPIVYNPAAERLTGIKKRMIDTATLSKDFGAFFPDTLTPVPSAQLPLSRALIGEDTNDVEIFLRNPSIPYGIHVSVTGRPLRDPEGKVFAGVVVFRDISAHKLLEKELKHYTEELEEKVNERTKELEQYLMVLHKQEAKEKALLESIGDGVIAADQDGVIRYVNQACEDMLGFSEDEMVGQQYLDLVTAKAENGQVIPATDRMFYHAFREQHILNGTYYYVRKDGSVFPAANTVSPIFFEGATTGVIVSFRDITKEKEIDRAKTEFVSLASHQLRTPPTGIKWFTGMLLAEEVGPLTEEQRSYLKEIAFNNQRMIDVVNTLLSVSRMELGTFNIAPVLSDVSLIVEGVLSELALQIQAKEIQVVKHYQTPMSSIMIDPVLVQIILQNLIFNAVKYTPGNGMITITLSILGPSLKIEIMDTGCGIPKAQQSKIFTKLFRAENTHAMDVSGTGLGLYIVKMVVTELGGDIHFVSEEDKGTTFFVNIPVHTPITSAASNVGV